MGEILRRRGTAERQSGNTACRCQSNEARNQPATTTCCWNRAAHHAGRPRPMLRRLLRRLSPVLLAPRCLVCAEAGEAACDLCAACRAALPWNRDACRQCALALTGPGTHCGAVPCSPPPYTRDAGGLSLRLPGRPPAAPLQVPRRPGRGRLLATLMQWPLDPARAPARIDAGAAASHPPARARLRPGAGAGTALARGMRLPLCRESPRAARAPRSAQTELGAAERQRNLRDAFGLRDGAPLPRARGAGRRRDDHRRHRRRMRANVRCSGVQRVDTGRSPARLTECRERPQRDGRWHRTSVQRDPERRPTSADPLVGAGTRESSFPAAGRGRSRIARR